MPTLRAEKDSARDGQQATTSDARYSALWLDNRIDDLLAVVGGLQKYLDVDCVKTSDEALARTNKKHYDIYLVDFLLDGTSSRSLSLVNAILTRDIRATIVFITGYLSLEEFETNLARIRREFSSASVYQIDKADLPVPQDPGFADFVKELIDMCASREAVEPSTLKFESTEKKKGALDFPDFTDFESLSAPEQETYLDAMFFRHRIKLDEVFSSGAVWILFCGSWDKPVAIARRFEDVWSDDRAIEFGMRKGYAPVAYSHIKTVDDIMSQACSKARGIDGYPVVKIERPVPATGEPHPFYVHFDTGNPVSLICDRTYTAAGWLTEKRMNFHLAHIGGAKLRARKFDLPGTQATDENGRVVPLVFTGLAIEDWERSRFGVACADDCTNTVKRNTGLCFFRTGLLGRTFQRECNLWIAVDCTRGVVRFLELQDP